MRLIAVLLLLASAGCDVVFNLDRGQATNDAPVAGMCPADYTDVLPGQSATRLKLAISARPAYEQVARCRDDLPGRTHLVSPHTPAEVAALIELLVMKDLAEPLFFVGGMQQRDADGATLGWVRITGGDLPSQWHTGEPDDGGFPERHVEDIAAVWASSDPDGMLDVDAGQSLYAVCACDDEQVTAQALDIIEHFPH